MLHHEVSGTGRSVVLVHAGGMSGRQWRRLALRLAASHRVIALDLLGSGENPPWPDDADFDYRLDVAAVGEIVDAFEPPVHLVGHSYGGLVALALARERPAAVRSIAVYDPVAFGVLHATADEVGLADLARAAENPIFLDDTRGGGEAWFEAFVDYWNGPGAWRALGPPTRAAFLKVGRKVYYEVRSLLADRTPPDAYGTIAAPALLLGGELSPPAAQRVVGILAAALPDARARVVAGAGHMGPITHAAEIDGYIVEHVGAADARAR